MISATNKILRSDAYHQAVQFAPIASQTFRLMKPAGRTIDRAFTLEGAGTVDLVEPRMVSPGILSFRKKLALVTGEETANAGFVPDRRPICRRPSSMLTRPRVWSTRKSWPVADVTQLEDMMDSRGGPEGRQTR